MVGIVTGRGKHMPQRTKGADVRLSVRPAALTVGWSALPDRRDRGRTKHTVYENVTLPCHVMC